MRRERSDQQKTKTTTKKQPSPFVPPFHSCPNLIATLGPPPKCNPHFLLRSSVLYRSTGISSFFQPSPSDPCTGFSTHPQTDSVGRALLPFVRRGDMRVMLISVGPRSCDELPGGGAGQSCRETSEGRTLQGLDCRQDREMERRKLQSEASTVGQTVFAFQWPCVVMEDGGQELVE